MPPVFNPSHQLCKDATKCAKSRAKSPAKSVQTLAGYKKNLLPPIMWSRTHNNKHVLSLTSCFHLNNLAFYFVPFIFWWNISIAGSLHAGGVWDIGWWLLDIFYFVVQNGVKKKCPNFLFFKNVQIFFFKNILQIFFQ